MNSEKTSIERSYAERIASFLDQMEPMFPNPQAAAELRRLDQLNVELLEALQLCSEALTWELGGEPLESLCVEAQTKAKVIITKTKESKHDGQRTT